MILSYRLPQRLYALSIEGSATPPQYASATPAGRRAHNIAGDTCKRLPGALGGGQGAPIFSVRVVHASIKARAGRLDAVNAHVASTLCCTGAHLPPRGSCGSPWESPP